MRSELAARLRSEWRYKLLLSIALPLYFCALYFALQRVVIFTPRVLSLTALDRAVPFDIRWTAVYQSLYLFLPMPWLAARREELHRYTRGFFAFTLISFAAFYLVPVAGPRPVSSDSNVLYQLLITYDRNLNAFPSLHAALAVYTLFLGARLLSRARTMILAAGGVWCMLILYATLATKQHYAVDVAAGIALAVAADAFAWGYTPLTQAEEV